jgi:hypothetical protein
LYSRDHIRINKKTCKSIAERQTRDGEVEALDGLPEGFDIPQMPEAPQEYSPGLDKELKQKLGVDKRIIGTTVI